MMKYIKAEDISEDLDSLELGKVRLFSTDEDDSVVETPWVKTLPDGRQVLQNHALNFNPFPSWGMVLPAGKDVDVKSFRESMTIALHPEAFDSYVETKVISEEGELLRAEKSEE